jgi:CheY-like chemotaxis protein
VAPRKELVIDDEPDITTYFAAVLSDRGWNVRTANSGDSGIALAREQRPDVILLDLMMPGRGGLSCLIALRKDPKLTGVPIVIVSGIQEQLTMDFRDFLAKAKTYNPAAFLDKPVDPAKLVSTLDAAVAAGK